MPRDVCKAHVSTVPVFKSCAATNCRLPQMRQWEKLFSLFLPQMISMRTAGCCDKVTYQSGITYAATKYLETGRFNAGLKFH
jgi:hypothetical protein